MKIESKIGKIAYSDEKIYNFVSDFHNIKNLIPSDTVKNWESTNDECSFELEGLGKTGMKIVEKEPYKLVKISSIETSPFKFFLWIQLKKITDEETEIKITIEPDINPMMLVMVKSRLHQFVDMLVDQISKLTFQ